MMPCPKCGGVWTRQSGMRRCKKCGYVYGTQDTHTPIPRPTIYASTHIDEWEDETLIRDKPGRQDTPLNFDNS
jgi:rubredoxin